MLSSEFSPKEKGLKAWPDYRLAIPGFNWQFNFALQEDC